MLTRDEILLEYIKCIKNPIYGIETYFLTFDKTQEGFVPFKLFPRQKEIIHAYEKHRLNLVTKPRQAGVSMVTSAYFAMKVGFADINNPEAILIIANKQSLAFEFLNKVKKFLSQLPRWVWGAEYYGSVANETRTIFITDSKQELVLPNGSRVKAVATSEDALRGYTPTYLVMDEAAYIDNGASVYGTAFTALGTGGKAILISTPNGMDKLYYETYAQSKTRDNEYNIIEMRWYEDLRYNKDLRWIKKSKDSDIVIEETETEFTFESYALKITEGYKPTSTWYENMCRGMNNDPRMIAQELDVSFIGSGGNVISEEDIDDQVKKNVQDPEWTSGEEGKIWIWKRPEEGHQYIMGVDVSRGDSEDSSTIVMLDFTIMEEVMEYQGKIPPDLLAQIVEEYGELYKAYTVVDITGGMGVTTVLKLLEFGYKRLHWDTPNGKILSNRQKELSKYDKEGKTPGLQVNTIRLAMIANFEEKIRNNLVKIRSIRMTSEMKTFVYKNGKPDHMDGYHDDLIFAMAMCLWVLEHSFKNLERLKEQSKAILNSWVTTNQVQEAGGEKDKNNGFVSKENRNKIQAKKPNFTPVVARNMQDPTGKYMWLFSGMR